MEWRELQSLKLPPANHKCAFALRKKSAKGIVVYSR
jgi:hypothetical protein